MKINFNKIRGNSFFGLFIFLFAYIQSIYSRILIREDLNIYIFTPEAAFFKLIEVFILFLIFNFFISLYQETVIFKTKQLIKFFSLSIIIYVLTIQTLGLLISFVFGNIDRNFNWHTVTMSSFNYFLEGIIYGSFILAYYYHHNSKKHQKQLTTYNQALSEGRINQLKAQLNPHFLFNNLNVLDQLIEEDKHKASDFLNEFADIYRYVLRATDIKLVLINEELAFARQYFKLIEHKFGSSYQLNIEGSVANNCYIVPLTMQLMIENAIQHNFGSSENPVFIKIVANDNICISNNINPKRQSKPKSGRALQNIKEQYKLLTQKSIIIQKSDNKFSVIIPTIQLE